MKFYEFLNILNQDISLAEIEIKRDANILKSKNTIGETHLHYCVIENKIKLVNFLKNQGSDINTQDEYGSTPIMHSIILNYVEVFDYLLLMGSNLELKTANGETALSNSVDKNRVYYFDKILPLRKKSIQYYFSDVDAMAIVENQDNELKLEVVKIGLINPYD